MPPKKNTNKHSFSGFHSPGSPGGSLGGSPSKKPKPDSPAVPDRSKPNLRTTIEATQGGRAMVQTITDRDGNPGYTMPIFNFLKCPSNNQRMMELKLHQACWEVDSSDHTEYRKGPPTPRSGYQPRYMKVVTYLPAHFQKNNAENRKAMADVLIGVTNSNTVQFQCFGNNRGFKNNSNRMCFAGDVTPQGTPNDPFANCSYISDHLTIGDTMFAIKANHTKSDGSEYTEKEITADTSLLDLYVRPELIPEVVATYSDDDRAFAANFNVPDFN